MNPYAPSQDDRLVKARHEALLRNLLVRVHAEQNWKRFEYSSERVGTAVQRPAVVAWRTDL
jgi:hypothetical protein